MSPRPALIHAAALVALVAGCAADPRTEIMVVVDSDMAVPGQIDGVVIEVTAPRGGMPQRTMGAAAPLPRSVGVLWVEGPLGPVTVRAQATHGGMIVVERVVRTSFVKERTVVLLIGLRGSCVGVTCADGQSCDEAACRAVDVPASTLPAWTGREPRIDGGTPPPPRDGGMDAATDSGTTDGGPVDGAPTDGAPGDAGPADGGPGDAEPPDGSADACVATGAEVCNGLDDDCNGTVDDGFDVATDPANCGSCGNVCDLPHSTVTCRDGACAVADCDTLYGDCNGRASDGCEKSLRSDDNNCGMCANDCGMGRRCCNGACQMGPC